MPDKTKPVVKDIDVQINSPAWAAISIHPARTGQRKANVIVAGLTRREFDALPGHVYTVTSSTPPRWMKHVSCAVTVYTEEAPLMTE